MAIKTDEYPVYYGRVRCSTDRQVGSGSRLSRQAAQGRGRRACWNAWTTTTNHDRLTPQVMATDCDATAEVRQALDAYPLGI